MYATLILVSMIGQQPQQHIYFYRQQQPQQQIQWMVPAGPVVVDRWGRVIRPGRPGPLAWMFLGRRGEMTWRPAVQLISPIPQQPQREIFGRVPIEPGRVVPRLEWQGQPTAAMEWR